ncbi:MULTISPECIES: hypothetical protein [unclassified Dietzia]|uniref:hypothetical protein n=1 Tax=unclassified Dietzia TaxID=2617939 RepID=UPI000D22913A|nr:MULTISPECIES: hypothetical protein [unclassified Dietzia]AVZ38819.1 hypothetical protein CT688_04290 [Dietzia sp. JS16-p6b]MBB1024265.1 hypothetical protein [Dietzia sp. DQ12-76]MBB1027706.1 hypothetical protein [Dietzia sp. DQ11-38-2]QGW23931.1 hypothetical protein GJR88_01393 [Dietzia sp. DQ12-45-1b]
MTDRDRPNRSAALGLTGLAVGLGIIGGAIGFATLLGITATARGGYDTAEYGPMALTAASSLVLSVLLITGAVMLWRAHRAARAVIGVAVTLLAVSTLARMVLDSVTFISVLGSVLSLCALVAMGLLLASNGVRDHVRDGVPLRLN